MPIKLAGEAKAGANATHDLGNDAVQVVERRLFDFEGPLRNIVQRLVIDAKRHVAVLDQLVH